jgi:hypothetical protein
MLSSAGEAEPSIVCEPPCYGATVAAEASLAMPKSRGRKKPKKLQLSKMMRDALLEQRAAFRAKFGRDPGPNDPLIFDRQRRSHTNQ